MVYFQREKMIKKKENQTKFELNGTRKGTGRVEKEGKKSDK